MLGLQIIHDGATVRRSRGARGAATALALAAGAAMLGVVGWGTPASGLAAQPAAQAAAAPQSHGMLNVVLPRRVLDTRTTTGGHHAKLGSGATMRLPVLGQDVPGGGVSAVLVNVTAVNESAGTGYLTLYPTGISRPAVSALNYRAGVSIANQALVRVGSDGTISIFNSAGTTDVLVDMEGWVGTDAGAANGQTTTGTPVRLLDTRNTTGGHKAPLAKGQSLTLNVAGAGGMPATGVSAIYANITAIPVGTASGYLTGYATDAAAPAVSTVSFMAGVVTANLTLLPVSSAGQVTITNHSAGANVLLDVAGWVSGGSVTADAGTQVVPSTSILDTRTSTGGHQAPVGPGASVSVKVLGVGHVPSAGVAAVVVHVTGVAPTKSTYFTALATGYPRSATSALLLAAASTVSNTVIVPVGPAGAISIYNLQGSVNVLIDVQGWVAAPVLTVVPPSASALGAGPLTTSDGVRARAILTNANRYGMTTWWNTIYPALVASPMNRATMLSPDDIQHLALSSTAGNSSAAAVAVNTTDAVRRLSMEGYGLAASIATGAYNPAPAPAGTGVPTATATARTVQIITKVVAAHITSKQLGWGGTGGSMLSAAYIGAAAWMLWSDVPPQVRTQVARMVYFEAESGLGQPLQFYANAAGTVLTPGDTGSDPDSWIPMGDQLAAVMMPGDPHAPLWQNTVVRDALVAWSRPSDDANATVVNGASVATWLGNHGSNVLSGGDLYNHNRIAPDYSTLIYQNMQDILYSALAGQTSPRAVIALVAPVYAAYTTVHYAAPPYLAPGGTVYTPGKATIYWPNGCDWGTGQEIPFALVDAETHAFGVGTPTSTSYGNLHASAELALQQLHADGHTYDTDAQYKYVGREEHVAQQAGQLYLTMFIRDHALASFSDSSYWLAPEVTNP